MNPPPSYIESFSLLLVLLNPFLMTIYLMELIRTLPPGVFNRVMLRAALISTTIFVLFALTGDWVFRDVLGVRLAALQIFGGTIFLIIAVRFVILGNLAISQLRGGDPQYLAGSVAMPFMIGPGTVSASVLAGTRMHWSWAVAAVVSAVAATIITIVVFKIIHDYVRKRYELLIERYFEIVGRISALIIGTMAVEMLIIGVELWLAEFHA